MSGMYVCIYNVHAPVLIKLRREAQYLSGISDIRFHGVRRNRGFLTSGRRTSQHLCGLAWVYANPRVSLSDTEAGKGGHSTAATTSVGLVATPARLERAALNTSCGAQSPSHNGNWSNQHCTRRNAARVMQATFQHVVCLT